MFHSPTELIWKDYFSATVWESNAARCHESKMLYLNHKVPPEIMCTLHTMESSLFLCFSWSLGVKLRGTTETTPENSMETETAWTGAKQK